MQARHLSLVQTKLDALLTGSHEQVFRYFILIPKPHKGYLGRALDSLKPRNWFAKPMLLIPLYRAASGELKRAPVADEGFEVSKPHDFVRQHPRAVQMAMLALKAGIKVGAAQLGVAIPAASLEALSMVTEGLVSETLQLSIEAMAEDAAAKVDATDVSSILEAQEKDHKIKKFLQDEAGKLPADEVLEILSQNDKFKKATRNEYALLKAWLDKLHPNWPAKCGLEPTVNQETGVVEWLPVEAERGTSASASSVDSPGQSRRSFSSRVGSCSSNYMRSSGSESGRSPTNSSAMARAHDWVRRQEAGESEAASDEIQKRPSLPDPTMAT